MKWKELKSSRRYLKNQWHPYGWEVSWKTTFVGEDGARKRIYQGSLGTDAKAAKFNAMHSGLALLDY